MTTQRLVLAARNSAIATGLLLLAYLAAAVVCTMFVGDHGCSWSSHRCPWGRVFGWLAASTMVGAGTCVYSLLRLWWVTRKQIQK